MNEAKKYVVEDFEFEFTPNGSPFAGVLATTAGGETYTSELSLTKIRSRSAYAAEAEALYGMDAASLKRALNEVCTLRMEEVAAAAAEGTPADDAKSEDESPPEEARELIESPGVLSRYVEDIARIRGVVKDREALKLQTLIAVGAQLAPLPNGKPAGANSVLIGEPGRGKNYICDAVAVGLPESFYLAFESASTKSLFYQAEQDPAILKHKWIYPNEAEATDKLVETFRPVLSGGKASHLTVNKDAEGRNAAQKLDLEGPTTITIPTVRNKLDTQLQTRLLVAELQDYEGRVAQHSRAVSRQLQPDYAGEDHTPRLSAWQAALSSLTGVRRVVFPLDHKEFCFDSDDVSHGARLWANLLGLMLAHAWLEQNNRDVVELASGERAVVATPGDYEAAYNIFKATCERSVVNLSGTHRKILDAVHELQKEGAFEDGFTYRQIAERAGIHHGTVGDNKTFLVKSAKLLREVEGSGLRLVAGAEPSWWAPGDLLAGFPRPEQVWEWWNENNPPPGPKTARQSRQTESGAQTPHGNGKNPVGHSTRQEPDSTRQGADNGESGSLSGRETDVSGKAPDSENPIDKGNSGTQEPLSALSGTSGGRPTTKNSSAAKCGHVYAGGKGCYLCDPNHPYRKQTDRPDSSAWEGEY